jgi:cytochrome c-type biogenesis protein CcmH
MKKLFIFLIYLFLLPNFILAEENSKIQIEVHKNLRCLVCQGQSIADSNSDFAKTIKLVVKDLIDEGQSKEEIYDFLVSKYGEWIVYKPAVNAKNFVLWFLPYIILLLGGIIILMFTKKGKNKRHN